MATAPSPTFDRLLKFVRGKSDPPAAPTPSTAEHAVVRRPPKPQTWTDEHALVPRATGTATPAAATTPVQVPAMIARDPAQPREETLNFLEFATPPRALTKDEVPPDDAKLNDLVPALSKGVRAVMASTPPAFPWFASKIVEAASKPETDAAELARLVSSDAMIATQVLRVANSATYARNARSVGLRESIARLGMKEVAQIAFISSSQTLASPSSREAFTIFPDLWKELWLQSIAISLSASHIASEVGKVDESTAFLGGLLHDIGKMIGLQGLCLGMRVERIPRLTRPETERLLHLTHVQVGVEVAETAKYPEAMLAVCRHHHDVVLPTLPQRRELAVVIIASALSNLTAGASLDESDLASVASAAHALRLSQATLRKFATWVRQARTRALAIMAFSADEPPAWGCPKPPRSP